MDFDAYDYLEKSVDEAEIGKRDGAEKTHRSFRRRNDKDDEDDIADSRSKRSRLDLHNGERRIDNDRDKSSRSERRDRDRHKSNRDAERERGRDRDRGDRERDKEREKRREKDKEMERDKEKDRVKERDRERERDKDRDKEAEKERERDRDKHREKERDKLRERERDKDREREREREKEKEKENERERVREREKEKERDNDKEKDKSQRSRRHPTHPDKDADREIPRGRSRDREAREKDRELEMRESRKYKEKKEAAEPEADPERDQRTVFAYQMPLKATEKDVYEFFSQAGKVRDVRLIMDRNSRRSKGVGYVEFYDAMSVPMAIALSGHRFLDHTVMVKPSEAEKNLVQSTSGVSGGLTGTYGAVARKLYVGNLHFNMTEDQLRQVFEPFGAVELVQLPIDAESKQCKGFGFVQFAQLEHAKAAQSLNGKLDIAGRIIKVSAVTDHPGFQNAGANAADFDDDDGGGLSLNAQSRAMLMQRLDRTGVATSIAGSLGVPLLNGSVPNQQTSGLHMNVQAAIPAPVPALVAPSPAAEPIGSPSMCLLLKNMFDPATEMDPEFDLDIREEVQEECSNFGAVKHIYVDKNSAGHVYLRFESVAAAASAQRAMHMRWFARRLILAVFMQPDEYEAKFSNGA